MEVDGYMVLRQVTEKGMYSQSLREIITVLPQLTIWILNDTITPEETKNYVL